MILLIKQNVKTTNEIAIILKAFLEFFINNKYCIKYCIK
jgi:hypothetical protein